MSAVAIAPSTFVTEIPGRFSPIYVVDKRTPASIATSTSTTIQNAFLPRCETVDSTFDTPVTPIDEVGTNFHVGVYDDLAEGKVSLSCYDAGYQVISLITGKAAPAASTTTWGFNELNNAKVDIIRQFADPNGNVFASMFQGDCVVNEFGFLLKQKSLAMESYSLSNFNMMKFRGQIQTKAYKVLTADHTTPLSGSIYGFTFTLGASEVVVPTPVPSGAQAPSYWQQNGCINFLKVERWNPATGFTRMTEIASAAAITVTGQCHYVAPAVMHAQVNDLVAGDIWFMTYCTYDSNAIVNSQSYKLIYQNSPDSSDALAVPTRLTPFTIAANNISRGQTLDVKLSLKRDRAEGIGDVTGLYGPSASPEVTVSLEVKTSDFALGAILETGSPFGTDTSGTAAGDFYDPNWSTRLAIQVPVALQAILNDPRTAGAVLKTYNLPSIILNNVNDSAAAKNAATTKFSGVDQFGNMTVSVTRP